MFLVIHWRYFLRLCITLFRIARTTRTTILGRLCVRQQWMLRGYLLVVLGRFTIRPAHRYDPSLFYHGPTGNGERVATFTF